MKTCIVCGKQLEKGVICSYSCLDNFRNHILEKLKKLDIKSLFLLYLLFLKTFIDRDNIIENLVSAYLGLEALKDNVVNYEYLSKNIRNEILQLNGSGLFILNKIIDERYLKEPLK